jgi:hypothetical protein
MRANRPPELAEPQKLEALLRTWPAERTLLFADEGCGQPMMEALSPGPAAILIGPKAASPTRSGRNPALPQAEPISLGPESCAPKPLRSPRSASGWPPRRLERHSAR